MKSLMDYIFTILDQTVELTQQPGVYTNFTDYKNTRHQILNTPVDELSFWLAAIFLAIATTDYYDAINNKVRR